MKKPLNHEAHEIAVRECKRLSEAKNKVADKLLEFTVKIQEIKAAAKLDLIERAKKCQHQVDEIIAEGDKLIDEADALHKEVFNRIRQAQPELSTIEFELHLDEGMYTPMGTRKDEIEPSSGPDVTMFNIGGDLPNTLPPGLEAVFQEVMKKVKQPPQNKTH